MITTKFEKLSLAQQVHLYESGMFHEVFPDTVFDYTTALESLHYWNAFTSSTQRLIERGEYALDALPEEHEARAKACEAAISNVRAVLKQVNGLIEIWPHRAKKFCEDAEKLLEPYRKAIDSACEVVSRDVEDDVHPAGHLVQPMNKVVHWMNKGWGFG
jgi:hypothetical protein